VVQAGDAARLARPTLLGGHQKINAALALAAVKILQPQIPVADAALRAGLASVNWPGRLQVIRRPGGNTILLDGAHNIAGATVLRAALEKEFAGAKPVLIFGALADKKWFDICTILSSTAHKILCVPVASERTAAAAELAAAFRAAAPNREIRVLANVAEALNASKDEPFVLITGSLYLVGEALERLACPPSDRSERGLNEWTAAKISR
jgi:dihydrofolate synthase/folylpolyglutamate synthase